MLLRRFLGANFYFLQTNKVCSGFLKRYYCNVKTSIDVEEEAFFKKHKSSWWDSENGPMKPLHSMNKVRVPFIRDCLINTGIVNENFVNSVTPLKDLCILDVGCGGGILSEALARIGANVVGLDATKDLIEIAREHAALDKHLKNLEYVESTIEEYSNQVKNKYDAVVLSEVIEHVTDKDSFIQACVKCLKPEGSIFITTISKTNTSWFVAILCAEYIFKFIPFGTHHWDKFIEPHKMQRLLEDNNCKTRLIHGFVYNPVSNQWHWSSNKNVTYGLHAVKES